MIRNMNSAFSMSNELTMPDIPNMPDILILKDFGSIDTSELSSSLEETPQEIANEESKSSILSFEVFKNGINPDTKDELSNAASTRFTNIKLNSNNKNTITTSKINAGSTTAKDLYDNSKLVKDIYSYVQEIESTYNQLETYNRTNLELLEDEELTAFILDIEPNADRLAAIIEADNMSDIKYSMWLMEFLYDSALESLDEIIKKSMEAIVKSATTKKNAENEAKKRICIIEV